LRATAPGDEALEQGADAVFKRVDLVLEQTRLQPAEDVQLLDQLEAFYPVITASEILPLIADRGGPETIAELVNARNDLTALVNARSGQFRNRAELGLGVHHHADAAEIIGHPVRERKHGAQQGAADATALSTLVHRQTRQTEAGSG
jgi:hypothetical protein